MERARFFVCLNYLRALKVAGVDRDWRRVLYRPFNVGFAIGWRRSCLEN